MEHRGEDPIPLKAMVPVNVRADDDGGGLGNRISFMFVELPCDQPGPAERLLRLKADVGRRKEVGEPETSDAVLQAAGLLPRTLQRVLSRMVSSPRVFNLVVSNLPGPPQPLWMNGF